MSKLRVIGTIKRSFNLLKKDATLVVPFVLPAILAVVRDRIITNYLNKAWESILWGPPEPPSVQAILLFVTCAVGGFLFGVWASAVTVLRVKELEKGNKLGLNEALSEALKKTAKLLVPTIISLVVFFLMIASLAIALTNYPLLLLGMGPSVVVLRVAIGCLFIIGLYVVVRLRLYAPACVLGNDFGLKRSWKLVKGSWWKLFAIVLIFWAMSGLVSQAWVIGPFLSGIIVGPFAAIAMTLAYFQSTEARSSREEHQSSL